MKTCIQNKCFENSTAIMAILNVTPDSFSDGGKYTNIDAVLKRTDEMILQGADIIDIGGESTKPNYTQISCDEEIERVCPVVEQIKSRFDIPISVDTYKYNVAKTALECGADMINDIWGFKKSPNIAKLVKEHNAACCLMHNRENCDYSDFYDNVLSDLKESVKIAKSAGIVDEKIIIDGGVGFAKTQEQNLEILKCTKRLSKDIGLPVMVAASRKSVIGYVLDCDVSNRLEGTLAITAHALMNGARFVRVHDIAENRRVIDMINAITNGGV